MSVPDAYRRIDALLQERARDHPRRVEPAWSDLLAAIDDVAARLLAATGTSGGDERLPSFYDKPVFVVGHRKTGTTLLLALLDGHPQLVVLPGESNHFVTFLPRFGALAPERIAAEAQRWWMLRLVSPSGIPPFWAAGEPWRPDGDPYARFTACLLELAAAYPDRDVLGLAAVALHVARGLDPAGPVAWVEKTPGQEHEVDAIVRRYPEARFVHVLRDPRSVAAAIARLDRETGHQTNLVDVGLRIERSFAAAAARQGDRYLAVRYEDLVAAPEATMRRVADFVGIEWAPSLLVPTVGGVDATSNSAWSERKVTGRIEGGRLDLWRSELDEGSAHLVAAATRGAARRFGYDLPRPGIRALAAVASRRARLLRAQVQKKIFSSGTRA